MKFTIECEMKDRWVPHFLGMLRTMQSLGGLGCSRVVGMYADGDGDFRPQFVVDGVNVNDCDNIHTPVYGDNISMAEKDAVCDYFWDAG